MYIRKKKQQISFSNNRQYLAISHFAVKTRLSQIDTK